MMNVGLLEFAGTHSIYTTLAYKKDYRVIGGTAAIALALVTAEGAAEKSRKYYYTNGPRRIVLHCLNRIHAKGRKIEIVFIKAEETNEIQTRDSWTQLQEILKS